MTADAFLLQFLEQDAALLLLRFDTGQRLTGINRYARELLGEVPPGTPAGDIFIDFHENFDLRRTAMQDGPAQLLNVSTRSGLPQTFYFTFFVTTDQILAIGQLNSTEMEDLRKELLLSNNSLSNLSRELHKKSAELTKLNELKNHFLGMAAHDLRNPLCAIMGYSEFMAMDSDSFKRPEFVQLLNDIRYLSEFMLSMINDLLDISVIESGRLQLDLEPRDFSTLLAKTVQINQVFAERNGVELILDDLLPQGRIRFDTPRIKQVLNNLISNALKFSDPGARIFVRATTKGKELTVAVIDNGPGLSTEDLQKLFRPYPKIATTPPRKEKGTGLGLAISKKIIAAHNGQIWAESEPGNGATFCFSLPDFQTGDSV